MKVLLFVLSLSFIPGSKTYAAPVLIKLYLEKDSDYISAKSFQPVVYQRFDNFVIVEIDNSELQKMHNQGLRFEIVDENPWTDKYYIISGKELARHKFQTDEHIQSVIDESGSQFLKLSSSEVEKLRSERVLMFEIQKKPIPFDFEPPQKIYVSPPGYDSLINDLVNLVSEESLFVYNKRLQDFQTRFVFADSMEPARFWIYNKFKEFGIDSVYFQPFEFYDYYFGHGYYTHYNIVATVPGTVNPDKLIVVGGHYDSIVWPPDGDPYYLAPGADDNGSGTAATLELARIIAKNPLPMTVMFVPFSAEEVILWGSEYFAWWARNVVNLDIVLMLNMDMIGYMENDTIMYLISHDSNSMPYAELMKSLASTYAGLKANITDSPFSDEWNFYQMGYPALFSFEYIFNNQGYHRYTDKVDFMNFSYVTKIAKTNMATVAAVSAYPSRVRNLRIMDGGDGSNLYVNWQPPLNENDIVSYKVYFGTQSGVYDSIHTVYTNTDTLRNLLQGQDYYIAVTAVNASGYEGVLKVEKKGTPLIVPRAPAEVAAEPAYKAVRLSWLANIEADLDYYQIHRSTSSGTGYQLWEDKYTDTFYLDTVNISGGVRYYYLITAIDTSGNESQFSAEVSSIAITLDQGPLIVDETANSLGRPGRPSDAQQDSFYNAILAGFAPSAFEYTTPQTTPLSLENLGPFSPIIWLDDDNSNHYLVNDQQKIVKYLNAGGKLFMASWKGINQLSEYPLPNSFSPGSFVYDYLHISWANNYNSYDFVGASGSKGYNSVQLDSSKLASSWEGKLASVTALEAAPGAESIYYYDAEADTGYYEGKVCGIRYLGSDHKVVYLSFPLFYLKKSQAQALVRKAMEDFGIYPVFKRGDVNGDWSIRPSDIVYLINRQFKGGPDPLNDNCTGDANNDGEISTADIIYLINYYFKSGSAPSPDSCS